MIKQLKNGVLQGIGIVAVIGIFGITYAAVTQVSTGETLTADIFNQSMVPTGAVMAFNGSSCPDGWNKADGSGDEKNTSGDLTTLDLRGEFIRGFDDGRGVDSGRVLASSQLDEFKSHSHTSTVPKGYYANSGNGYGGLFGLSPTTTRTSNNTGGSETRPRNIALLYCIKD